MAEAVCERGWSTELRTRKCNVCGNLPRCPKAFLILVDEKSGNAMSGVSVSKAAEDYAKKRGIVNYIPLGTEVENGVKKILFVGNPA